MRFHYPSVIHHLDRAIPEDMVMMSHHYTVYIWATFPVRRDFLRDAITQAVLDSYETPLQTPTPTEEASLIRGLLAEHERTLKQALKQTTLYIKAFKNIRTEEGGERLTEYEYHILLKEVETLCIDSLERANLFLIKKELYHEPDASIRKVQKKLEAKTGKVYSKDRIARLLNIMEEEGLLNRNGGLRIYGRDVIHEKF